MNPATGASSKGEVLCPFMAIVPAERRRVGICITRPGQTEFCQDHCQENANRGGQPTATASRRSVNVCCGARMWIGPVVHSQTG